ncbi:cytochrome c oxidase assembly protein [Gimesia panareensis]|uniref:cytochrome c oxidase assembly protein n=1 Tax=Gimesia panareensis TaxID=2527978 RepID=UPI00118B97F0|nr:cytochrome c oxidase assembly protein [Gimesia panareensis]QDU49149.1 Cytochrome c oxidase caa3 assembly factor (Caa3_CtaG) [Gimesia panareensis]
MSSYFDLTGELWKWNSPIWLLILALTGLYILCLRGQSGKQIACFALSMLSLAVAYVSPIGVLSDGYLFSAHVIQHLILLLIVPLLLLLSLPGSAMEKLFENPLLNRMGHVLAVPFLGWLSGLGVMWFWHIPSFCSASTESYSLGIFRDATFLLAGLAFWWPIFSPVKRFHLPSAQAVLYLFSACLGCTLLGIYITFTVISVCPAFANPVDRLGILNMLYDQGMTPAADQKLGGLLMWVPPCSLYVSAIMVTLKRWYGDMEPQPAADTTGSLREAHR